MFKVSDSSWWTTSLLHLKNNLPITPMFFYLFRFSVELLSWHNSIFVWTFLEYRLIYMWILPSTSSLFLIFPEIKIVSFTFLIYWWKNIKTPSTSRLNVSGVLYCHTVMYIVHLHKNFIYNVCPPLMKVRAACVWIIWIVATLALTVIFLTSFMFTTQLLYCNILGWFYCNLVLLWLFIMFASVVLTICLGWC